LTADDESALLVVAELNNLARVQKDRGNFTDARLLYERAIAKLRSTSHDPADVATLLGNLALLHRELREYDVASGLYAEVLHIRRQVLGEKHPGTTTTLKHIAELHDEAGDYPAALETWNELLESCGSDAEARNDILHSIANVHYRSGDYRAAIPVLEQLLSASRNDTTTSVAIPVLLNNLGLSYGSIGEYERAERLLMEALNLAEASRETAPSSVETMLNLGDLHQRRRMHREARAWYERAIARGHANDDAKLEARILIAISKLDLSTDMLVHAVETARQSVELTRSLPDRDAHVSSLQALGHACLSAGRYGEAETALREAIALARGIDGGKHLRSAQLKHDLACVLQRLGCHADARMMLQDALRIKRNILPPSHPEIAMTLGMLAAHLHSARDYEGAIGAGEAALKILDSMPEVQRPEHGWILHNIATSYAAAGRAEDAVSAFGIAVERLTAAHGPHSLNVAMARMNIGVVLFEAGHLEEARVMLSTALATLAETGRDRVDDYATCATNLAAVAAQSGNDDEAERLYLHAAETLDAKAGPTHPLHAEVQVQLATLYAQTGRRGEALTLLHDSARRHDRLLVEMFASSSEAQRLTLADALRAEMLAVVSLTMDVSGGDATAIRAAADLILRRKGISAEAVAVQRDALWEERHEGASRTMKDLYRLRQRIAQARLGASRAVLSEMEARDLARWEDERETLEREVAAEIPRVTMEWRLRSTNARTVARALPPGTVLIDLLRVPPIRGIMPRTVEIQHGVYVAVLLFADDADRVEMVPLGDAERIDELSADFLIALTSMARSRDFGPARVSRKRSREWRDVGDELRKIVFDPLLPFIGNARDLMIAADGDLFRLPVDVLPWGKDGHVIDDFRVTYLSAGRDALRLNDPPGAVTTAPLVVADPDFDLETRTATDDPIVRSSGKQAADLNRSGDLQFARLPGTRVEGQRIASLLNVQPLLGEQALEAAIKERTSPRILHVATHGYFLPDADHETGRATIDSGSPEFVSSFARRIENPMLRSGLALAGANTWLRGGALPEAAEDALLNGEDVCGLELAGTELVVLSACETGLGEIHVGEGVYGLRRAFMLAGARTLVISLWKVPDRQTQELMEIFYAKLAAGMQRGDALRLAKLALKSRYREPFYWGAFICQGDPRKLAHPLSKARH
jgi:CHAT domain-containing protein/tetratricopeptide (TPR) repeat protein